MTFEQELALALWTSEAARSVVLGIRGHTDASVRVAGRARILATRCSELGVALRPDFAGEHARWMGQVAGTPQDSHAAFEINSLIACSPIPVAVAAPELLSA